jgi:hypothetical protein
LDSFELPLLPGFPISTGIARAGLSPVSFTTLVDCMSSSGAGQGLAWRGDLCLNHYLTHQEWQSSKKQETQLCLQSNRVNDAIQEIESHCLKPGQVGIASSVASVPPCPGDRGCALTSAPAPRGSAKLSTRTMQWSTLLIWFRRVLVLKMLDHLTPIAGPPSDASAS